MYRLSTPFLHPFWDRFYPSFLGAKEGKKVKKSLKIKKPTFLPPHTKPLWPLFGWMGRTKIPLAGDLTLFSNLKTAGRAVRRVAGGGKSPHTTHPKPGRETPVCRYPSAGHRLRHLPHGFLGVCYIIYIYVRDKSQNTGPIRSDRRVRWSCIYIGIKKTKTIRKVAGRVGTLKTGGAVLIG